MKVCQRNGRHTQQRKLEENFTPPAVELPIESGSAGTSVQFCVPRIKLAKPVLGNGSTG